MEQDRRKETAAQRWVRTDNHHGELGHWIFFVYTQPRNVKQLIDLVAFGHPTLGHYLLAPVL